MDGGWIGVIFNKKEEHSTGRGRLCVAGWMLRRKLTVPSVVQRQLWLLHNVPNMSMAKAYDQARHEFYALRHAEDVERRVAKEEAQATGAYFGKSQLEIGMEIEDQVYEQWKAWAKQESAKSEQARGAAYTGLDAEPDTATVEAATEEGADAVPGRGQTALGGAPLRP